MRGAFEPGGISDQELATPCGVVSSPTESIERHADCRARVLVINQARHQVGMMVLYGKRRCHVLRHCELGGEVLGMQIVHNESGFNVCETELIGDRELESAKRGRIFEIAEMDRYLRQIINR
jgi:hypothetical protein